MFHNLNGSAHCAHRQTNLPLRFGNRLLLGGVTTLGSQCDTPDENDIALFGSEDAETHAQGVDGFIEFRLSMIGRSVVRRQW